MGLLRFMKNMWKNMAGRVQIPSKFCRFIGLFLLENLFVGNVIVTKLTLRYSRPESDKVFQNYNIEMQTVSFSLYVRQM